MEHIFACLYLAADKADPPETDLKRQTGDSGNIAKLKELDMKKNLQLRVCRWAVAQGGYDRIHKILFWLLAVPVMLVSAFAAILALFGGAVQLSIYAFDRVEILSNLDKMLGKLVNSLFSNIDPASPLFLIIGLLMLLIIVGPPMWAFIRILDGTERVPSWLRWLSLLSSLILLFVAPVALLTLIILVLGCLLVAAILRFTLFSSSINGIKVVQAKKLYHGLDYDLEIANYYCDGSVLFNGPSPWLLPWKLAYEVLIGPSVRKFFRIFLPDLNPEKDTLPSPEKLDEIVDERIRQLATTANQVFQDLEKSKTHKTRAKRAFWHAHDLAEALGFPVKPKFGDYLKM